MFVRFLWCLRIVFSPLSMCWQAIHIIWCRLTYPYRDGLWLHGLLSNGEQSLAHYVQVNLFAQRRSESFDSLNGRIIAQVKALLHKCLNISTQRLKHDGQCQRGGDHNVFGNSGVVRQKFEPGDATEVEECQEGSQELHLAV